MKFSHSLQFNAVPEWSSRYIAYSNLKKLIYNLQRESLTQSGNNTRHDSESSYLITQDQSQDRDLNKVFLTALDAELKRIDKFYKEKEASTYQDYELLIDDLAEFETQMTPQVSRVSQVLDQSQSNLNADEDGATHDQSEAPATENNNEDPEVADEDGVTPFRGRSNSNAADNRWRRNESLLRSRSPEFWDNDYDSLKTDPFNVLADIRITLKRRTIALFTLTSELKSYVELNKTGFTKILKKYDKSLNTRLKEDYLQSMVANSYIFSEKTGTELKNRIDKLIHIYATLATNGNIENAKSELRLHLREHVVWERNTVWKDMIGMERKAQAATLARKGNSKEILAVGDEDVTPSSNGVNANGLKLTIISLITVALLIWSPFEEVEQKNCFAILICASLLWATETIPLFVTSLLVPLLIVVFGVLKDDNGNRMDPESSSKFILGAMWSSVIMLLLGGFTLAAALSKYNIAKIISTWILSKAGTNPKVILLTIMVVALVVSMWVSNVAAPVLCYSIIQSLLRTLPRGSAFGKQLVIGVALASNVGGMASPIASPQNIISIGIMDPPPSWGQWFVVSLPVSAISLVLIWIYLLVTFSSNESITIGGIRTVDDKFTRTQWFVSLVTIITIVLWCLANQLKGVFGEMGIISIIPMILFFGTGLLTAEDFNNFLWTIVVLAMGGIALGKAVATSGLLATIALAIQQRVEHFSLFAILLIFGALILVVATFVSHTVAALIIVPLVAEIGSKLDDPHPNLLIMASAFLCSCAMGLPTSGFPNVTAISLVDDLGERYLTVGNFIVGGVPSSLFAYLTVVTVGYLLMRFSGM
ncbi:CYFA0S01e00386g1_1 [Cyberlindnera fabianii]|uniref:CYFA0S01e00386g1_1 n=2 Tax=Cyberlindnera fabianii TaxID=36022 RepID=A0A061AGP0_CYBFA|nr:CYFA0S01e00386g1_1 [Cyberlindnera fabianii]